MSRTHSPSQSTQKVLETNEQQQSQQFGSNTDRISRLKNTFSLIVQDSLEEAKTQAHQIAEEGRSNGEANIPDWAGWIWQTSKSLDDAQQSLAQEEWSNVQSTASNAAQRTRDLKEAAVVDEKDAQSVESAAGGYWSKANQAQQAAQSTNESQQATTEQRGKAGPYAVWTTGGGSSLLPRGNWGAKDLRDHHSDRRNSGAAHRVRASSTRVDYNSVNAYDFTFEKMNSNGQAIAGSAHGLPLMVPVRSLVVDIQKTFQGSGGYGKFILLEYLEGDFVGQRVEIHHLDTVGDFRIGHELPAGMVFGTQGASGNSRFGYDTHVDIVGTAEAVVLFAKTNQSGNFKTQKKPAETQGTQKEPQEPVTAAEFKDTSAPSLETVRTQGGLIKRGMIGESVKHIQKLLQVDPDGIFGPITEQAVLSFQKNAQLKAPAGLEGVVGKTTLASLEKQRSALNLGEAGAMGISPLAITGTKMGEKYSPQLTAFARAITYAEGTADGDGYFREVGNKNYGSNQQTHPGAENVYRYMETGYNSDAYGRYQMLSTTWASWARQSNIPTIKQGSNKYGEAYYSMAPEYQDKAMLDYLVRSGVQNELLAGNVEGAVRLVRGTWSSLPGGSQPNDKTPMFYNIYKKMLSEEMQRTSQR